MCDSGICAGCRADQRRKKHGDYAGVVDIARNGIDRVNNLEKEVERLRARVAELEASASEVFTAMLVEIDGHTYGLRPGAARVVREALADDPELDCTDFAKPAWWRGEAYGSSAAIAAVTRILDGKDDGRGVANEPWQSVRTRLREAMRDAGRYRLIRDGDGWPAAFGSAKDPEPLRDFMLDEAIRIAEKHAAMAKDGA